MPRLPRIHMYGAYYRFAARVNHRHVNRVLNFGTTFSFDPPIAASSITASRKLCIKPKLASTAIVT